MMMMMMIVLIALRWRSCCFAAQIFCCSCVWWSFRSKAELKLSVFGFAKREGDYDHRVTIFSGAQLTFVASINF